MGNTNKELAEAKELVGAASVLTFAGMAAGVGVIAGMWHGYGQAVQRHETVKLARAFAGKTEAVTMEDVAKLDWFVPALIGIVLCAIGAIAFSSIYVVIKAITEKRSTSKQQGDSAQSQPDPAG
ncbi:MAG: hypothetical protein JSS51_04005 [Planctomycetes bacterium]|nr:hypothetical protein [Planctomycetota bacterium]